MSTDPPICSAYTNFDYVTRTHDGHCAKQAVYHLVYGHIDVEGGHFEPVCDTHAPTVRAGDMVASVLGKEIMCRAHNLRVEYRSIEPLVVVSEH